MQLYSEMVHTPTVRVYTFFDLDLNLRLKAMGSGLTRLDLLLISRRRHKMPVINQTTY